MDLSGLRQSYVRGGLLESDVHPDPLEQFALWFDQARSAGLDEPNAMCLATADAKGVPNARTVLLKGVQSGGFVFFTNYLSRKGSELTDNPHAALLFYWPELERQVRVQGTVEPLEAKDSDTYFNSRPRGHQLGAWASDQSSPVPDRQSLDTRLEQVAARFAGQPVPRPDHWGGFRLRPNVMEFWQGRPNRLHDRIEFQRLNGTWTFRRLAP